MAVAAGVVQEMTKRNLRKSTKTANSTKAQHGCTGLWIAPEGGRLPDGKVGISSVPPNSKGDLERVQKQIRRLEKENPGVKYNFGVRKIVFEDRASALERESKVIRWLRNRFEDACPLEKKSH